MEFLNQLEASKVNANEPNWKALFDALLDVSDECRRVQTLYRMPRNATNRRIVEAAEAKLDELLALHRLPELPTASSSSATSSSSAVDG